MFAKKKISSRTSGFSGLYLASCSIKVTEHRPYARTFCHIFGRYHSKGSSQAEGREKLRRDKGINNYNSVTHHINTEGSEYQARPQGHQREAPKNEQEFSK